MRIPHRIPQFCLGFGELGAGVGRPATRCGVRLAVVFFLVVGIAITSGSRGTFVSAGRRG
ncbi:hypothetical protein [Nocardia salmonicida]|uniref:hypothetical protein n=1 Tax=Nocardia salmonicida TaxID=53431 RepID=UPI000B03F2C6|nr:hypothetical protein [Nocardia salmonicida]